MSLTESLDSLRAGAAQRIPADALKVMHQATADLRSSGIVNQVLKVGDSAPPFALPDPDGTVVRSSELLEKGPLVVTFYRGFW